MAKLFGKCVFAITSGSKYRWGGKFVISKYQWGGKSGFVATRFLLQSLFQAWELKAYFCGHAQDPDDVDFRFLSIGMQVSLLRL